MTAVLLDAPPANTPEWEDWRHCGLGASEIAATFGASPYITERGLALQKRRMVADTRPSTAMNWGHRMEQVGADEYTARTGRVLVAGLTFGDTRWPHLYASPDRGVEGDPTRLVELKWTNRWDEPPKHVRIQNQAQMGLSGADVVDVVRMGPYGEPSWVGIEREDDSITSMLDWGEEWYCRYVLGDELPDEDGSPESQRYATSLLGPGAMTATDDQVRLIERLRVARQDIEAAEHEYGLARGLLTASMAGHDELDAPGFHLTFHASKGRRTTDWKAVAIALSATQALIEEHTTTGEPSRSFRPTWF